MAWIVDWEFGIAHWLFYMLWEINDLVNQLWETQKYRHSTMDISICRSNIFYCPSTKETFVRAAPACYKVRYYEILTWGEITSPINHSQWINWTLTTTLEFRDEVRWGRHTAWTVTLTIASIIRTEAPDAHGCPRQMTQSIRRRDQWTPSFDGVLSI